MRINTTPLDCPSLLHDLEYLIDPATMLRDQQELTQEFVKHALVIHAGATPCQIVLDLPEQSERPAGARGIHRSCIPKLVFKLFQR